ncbi:MAG: WD40 repeat domain-containing protein [Arcobacter sp.]|jgi:dipeptidyl aminopeptidase/acylaminoacyl peptidase|uniref:WD40 repeat domain-containing protein n=1 Tax=Arcobacter sp. TaxID=1872629 RepID=UPI0025897DF5|nr:WD40 repeat domain-containing protein [Arcobacter sp.]MDD3007532.1 WD40 repeat domain-containing protein [Arcobacter sp.]MDY3203517.1 WD40 repeat domain-containing protein [Arcobacter sp.]
MNILKTLFFCLILFLNLNAKDLEPNFSLIASGAVTDLVLKEEKLYVATTASSLDIFDINTKEKIDSIKTSKIKDFTGDMIDSKIYSVDVLEDNILLVSQGENGGRFLSIFNNGKISNLIEDKERLFIARAKFLDENHLIFALLSNQIYLYDIKNKKVLKELQISQSKFSNFKLTSDKTKVVVSDESGILTMLNSKTFEIIKTFKNQNLDNVFQVDIKNDIILTAGQDRRSAVYSLDGRISYYKEFSFLIYSAGLSPSGTLAAVASDEENNVTVFNVNSKENICNLTQNRSTLTNILFINENEIIVSSDDKKINFYKLN